MLTTSTSPLLHLALALAAATTSTVHAASHRIDVGRGGLTFTPDTITAAVGDTVDFYFVGGTHDAVTSEYATPCSPRASGERFSSGVQAGSANNKNVFRVTINSTEPMYYYCSVGMHCANGMVAAINPLANQTVADLKTSARGKSAGKPTGVYGGVMTTVP
ncbi:Cupredoxin [Canariomyces notabilis]|uniref:Cupredoxin n=1 Tax=Canariomyces notabilis TaxID=2074819 RepID=A0AAN6TKB0_9PEZI|nr:Cupredoxin [Canariomyces arenarius]